MSGSSSSLPQVDGRPMVAAGHPAVVERGDDGAGTGRERLRRRGRRRVRGDRRRALPHQPGRRRVLPGADGRGRGGAGGLLRRHPWPRSGRSAGAPLRGGGRPLRGRRPALPLRPRVDRGARHAARAPPRPRAVRPTGSIRRGGARRRPGHAGGDAAPPPGRDHRPARTDPHADAGGAGPVRPGRTTARLRRRPPQPGAGRVPGRAGRGRRPPLLGRRAGRRAAVGHRRRRTGHGRRPGRLPGGRTDAARGRLARPSGAHQPGTVVRRHPRRRHAPAAGRPRPAGRRPGLDHRAARRVGRRRPRPAAHPRRRRPAGGSAPRRRSTRTSEARPGARPTSACGTGRAARRR